MSNISHTPHDKLVRKFLEDKKVAIDLLKNHLPAKCLENLDLSTLETSSATAVSDEWKKYHNDIVFHCKTKDKKDTYIYTLIEHQSTPDRFMPIRMRRYELNVLAKHLDGKKQPEKLPNVISLVIYHGKRKYPYAKDTFSCFQDKELAFRSIVAPMNLVDLADIPEDSFKECEGADTVLKILLRYGRDRDFIQKIVNFMRLNPIIFVDLSGKQVGVMYEYTMLVGQGTRENEKAMKQAIRNTYGAARAEKFFSLADYFRQGGIDETTVRFARKMLMEGEHIGKISKYTGLTPSEVESLANA